MVRVIDTKLMCMTACLVSQIASSSSHVSNVARRKRKEAMGRGYTIVTSFVTMILKNPAVKVK
jgi:hypothetical protein